MGASRLNNVHCPVMPGSALVRSDAAHLERWHVGRNGVTGVSLKVSNRRQRQTEAHLIPEDCRAAGSNPAHATAHKCVVRGNNRRIYALCIS